jgi:glycine/D-amino acid oxidase-like deaminating enzyme
VNATVGEAKRSNHESGHRYHVTYYDGLMRGSVVVVGAGIIGAACSRALSKRGFSVTIVERGASVGGTSASGEGNLLVSDKAPGAELTMAQYASRLWPDLVAELANELGRDFPSLEFEPKGGLVVALADSDARALESFAAHQREYGVRAEPLGAAEARLLEPDLNPRISSAVFYPDDAQVQPVIAAEAFLASARALGTRVVLGASVIGALAGDQGELAGVRTTKGDFPCDHVVVAAGPWSGEVARVLGGSLPVAPRKGFILVTSRMTQRVHHKVYDADYVGAVESDDRGLQTSTVVESTASGTVLIGSSRERVGFDASLDVAVVSELATKATRLFPFLSEASLMRVYCGFRPFVPDHVPVIGEDPTCPGLWYATGHEGAGIGLAPSTAEILAATLSGEEPAIDADPYSPARPSLASFLTNEPTE